MRASGPTFLRRTDADQPGPRSPLLGGLNRAAWTAAPSRRARSRRPRRRNGEQPVPPPPRPAGRATATTLRNGTGTNPARSCIRSCSMPITSVHTRQMRRRPREVRCHRLLHHLLRVVRRFATPSSSAVRAVTIAWMTMRPAPLAAPAFPARSRIPAITAAARLVLIVVRRALCRGSVCPRF